jgi:hypothetical protein
MDVGASPANCIPNIGPRERRLRLALGVVALASGVAIAVLLLLAGMRPLFRLPLFFPFWVAALGVFQARDKT